MPTPLSDQSLCNAAAADHPWHAISIAVVIPAYNEAAHLADVVRSVPRFVRHILVVDDASRDRTPQVALELAAEDPRVIPLRHLNNRGVGGAMITGFKKAIELGAQIVVKMDGDGQMGAEHLPALLKPLVLGEADYAKGNRFHDFRALAKMPPLRRAGNMALSFLTKASVGYWTCFDPCNGFVAIRGEVLAALPLEKIDRGYYFETSMLAQLYLLGAVVKDVPMPARYGREISDLSIRRVLLEFPPRLAAGFLRRIVLKNFLYDFSLESLFLLAGGLLLSLGVGYGSWNWIAYALSGQGAPTGTVVIPAMLIILGFQVLLSAIGEDVRSVPREPLCDGALGSSHDAESRRGSTPAWAHIAALPIATTPAHQQHVGF